MSGDDRDTLPDGVAPDGELPDVSRYATLLPSDPYAALRDHTHVRGQVRTPKRPDTSVAFERGINRFNLAAVCLLAICVAVALLTYGGIQRPAPQDPTPPKWDGGTQVQP